MTDHVTPNGLDFNSLLIDLEGTSDIDHERVPTPYELHNLKCLYWDPSDLPSAISQNDKDLIVHFNIQSLPSKFDNLTRFLNDASHQSRFKKPIVLALSETWLNDFNNSSFELNEYHPPISEHRRDNSDRGGVALFVNEAHEFRERPDLNKFIPKVFESVFITLIELNLTVGVIYRSPSADTNIFMHEYQLTINHLHESNEHFVILGDYNIDLLKYTQDGYATEFVDSTFEHGCIPLITKPTRVTPTSATCIDNIITNKIYQNSEPGIIVHDISDHFAVFYAIPNSTTNKFQENDTQYNAFRRNFSAENITKLNNELLLYNWDTILHDQDPNSAAKKFQNILADQITVCCPPLKTARQKGKRPNQPWFTKGLKISCKKKQSLFKKSLKNP